MRIWTSALTRLSVIVSMLALAACDTGRLTDPPSLSSDESAAVGSIVVSPDTSDLAVGDIVKLKARIYDVDGKEILGRDVQWRTSQLSRVKLTPDGTLEGLDVGDDTVFASLDGYWSRAVLRIRTSRVSAVVMELSTTAIAVGGTAQASALLFRSNGDEIDGNIYWSSSNAGVARIDADGLITGLAPGKATISAISGGRMDSEVITVSAGSAGSVAASVSVQSSASMIYVGKRLRLGATVRDGSGRVLTEARVSWSTSNPHVATISDSGEVEGVGPGVAEFSAMSDGTIGQTALTVALPPVNSVSLALLPASIQVGQVSQTSVQLLDSEGASLSGRPVTYVISNSQIASIDANGTIVGKKAGAATVTASSEGKSATASLTVTTAPIAAPVLNGVAISPANHALQAGQSKQFSMTGEFSDGSTGPATGSFSATGGTITAAGLFTAGSATGTFRVVAKSGAYADTAVVTISEAAPTLTGISISPSTVSLGTAEARQFIVTGSFSNGNVVAVQANFSATGGSVSGTGLYLAGTTPGTYRVVAQVGAFADTAVVAVADIPAMVGIEVSPASVQLQVGESRNFSALARFSNGSTSPVNVSWSATGGSITQGGSFSTGSVIGKFLVIAVCACGYADSSTVDVVAPPPSQDELAALTVSPSTLTLAPGETRKFIASGWVSGGSTPISTPVIWSATGGSIDQSGNFTAGSTPGNYVVRAQSTISDWRLDSAVVTVAAAASPATPTVISFDLTPSSVALTTGGTRQFQYSAVWSDGANRSVSVSYSATGGSITSGGFYTAGQSAGNYRVIATCSCGLADTSAISITAPTPPPSSSQNLAALTVSPSTLTMNAGESFQFVANGWLDGASSPISTPVVWTATGGSVDANGRFTAGNSTGTFVVRAVSTIKSWKRDSSVVTITAAGSSTPTLEDLSLTPAVVSVAAGGTIQFQSVPTWSDGANRSVSVSYSATGGTISSNGLYTAGQNAGTYRVIVSGGGKADTSSVSVSAPSSPAPSPTLSSLSLTPGSVSVVAGTSVPLVVTALWSNGGTSLPTLSWSATGGTVNSLGLYTAGSSAGTYRVIVSGGGKADTTSVTVTALVETPPAAPPPPGAGEPIPGGTILFDTRAGGAHSYQSMTSIDQLKSLYAERRNSNGASDVLEMNVDGNGTRARAINWAAPQGSEQEALLGRYIDAPSSGFYTSWKMRLSPGFSLNGTPGQHQKLMLWLRGDVNSDGGSFSRIYMSMTPGGTNFRIDGHNYNSPGISINPLDYAGQIQRWVVWIQPSTGTIKCWFNGQLVLNATGQNIGGTGLSQIQQTVTTFPGKSSQTQHVWDMVVWR